MVRLAYNQLPQVAYWWLDGYVDFTDAQTVQVRADIAHLHQWHRKAELPRLADALEQSAQSMAADITPEQACVWMGFLRNRMQAVMEQAEPAVVALVASLSPAQIQHLQAKYQRNNDSYRKDWLERSPAEQKTKLADRTLSEVEAIYGRLDDTSRALLRQLVADSVYSPALVYQERRRRQVDMLSTLNQIQADKPPLPEVRNRMHALYERNLVSPDAAYRAYEQTLWRQTCDGLSRVHAGTTPAHREAAARRLRAYERDLRDLVAS